MEQRGEHLYVQKWDRKGVENRLNRKLHVCPAINPAGLHLAVELVNEGNEKVGRAGINLTPKQARRLHRHIGEILDA